MKNNDVNTSRRQMLKKSVSGFALASVTGLLPLVKANAEHHEMPKLDENDPAAIALGYKHDATQVDVKKHPNRAGKAGSNQFCRNCNLYLADEKASWGGCRIFPDKLVNGKGWCSAWIRK